MKHDFDYAWENKKQDELQIAILNNVFWYLEPVESFTKFSRWRNKMFKNQKEALKYAKHYMNTH